MICDQCGIPGYVETASCLCPSCERAAREQTEVERLRALLRRWVGVTVEARPGGNLSLVLWQSTRDCLTADTRAALAVDEVKP